MGFSEDAIAQQHELDLQVQNNVVDNNVNLSVCAAEVGMLQPEALSQAAQLLLCYLVRETVQ